MIVGQLDVKRIRAFKAENNVPVRPHSNRSKTFQVALKRMQAITGKVHSLRRFSSVQASENVFHSLDQVGSYTAWVIALIKSFEAAMLEASNDLGYAVKCTLSLV